MTPCKFKANELSRYYYLIRWKNNQKAGFNRIPFCDDAGNVYMSKVWNHDTPKRRLKFPRKNEVLQANENEIKQDVLWWIKLSWDWITLTCTIILPLQASWSRMLVMRHHREYLLLNLIRSYVETIVVNCRNGSNMDPSGPRILVSCKLVSLRRYSMATINVENLI